MVKWQKYAGLESGKEVWLFVILKKVFVIFIINMKTSKEGVTTIFDNESQLVGIIYKDMNSRKNIFYKCQEMSMEELEMMVGSDTIKIKNNEI